MKRKQISMTIVCVVIFAVSITGLVSSNKNKTAESTQQQAGHYHDDGTFHADEDEEAHVEEPAEMHEIASDLGLDLDKIKKEGKTYFKKDTSGREVSADVERLYLANYIIKYIMTSEKSVNYYKDKLATEDNEVISQAIAQDVADYMNEGYDGNE